MHSAAAVQRLVQRSTVGLGRSASAIAASRTLALAAGVPITLRATPTSTSAYTNRFVAAAQRSFSQTAVPCKKKKVTEDDDHADGGNHPAPKAADAFNFEDTESRWQRTEVHYLEKFKELKRSLSGGGGAGDGDGGVDVDAIGKTRVVQKSGDEAGDEVPLSQLALIIPRAGGRVVELRMHNPASRKAITSAVQTNPLFQGQQPQLDPNDELVLLIRLGGANDKTTSSAAAAAERLRRVHDLANAWRTDLRKATTRRQKIHQGWKKDKSVQPDDLFRLDRELLKGQDKRMAKVDATEKDAAKHAERINKR
ncbi:hypothetical protein HMPREF1624_03066 [Sporothrix schenckii ATCC 58251]|uniref:Ribosome recycling factor domain-containing protein n=1 Tax=Sporothrix schenckii (strain ATCC 58251 / de Perez 2211183) TaxID=1391915 RepID=U7PVM4_SPOS1|nr:hypothetical protein HMPREF1624_03066 [Sporothrix schenckii ATCC 58251]